MANSPRSALSLAPDKPAAAAPPGEASSGPDWERIEADYRAGVLSLREIANPHGVTEGALRKRAKREGWERDLNARIQAKAEALVRKQAVRSTQISTQTASDKQIIEANATRIAQVRGEHRHDIARQRELVIKMLAVLERVKEWTLKLVKEYAPTLKTLGETHKLLVTMEREAYGIDKLMPEAPAAKALVDDRELARRVAFLLAKAGAQTSPFIPKRAA